MERLPKAQRVSGIRLIQPSDRFPFSHAVAHGGLVYVSGQVGFKPGTTEVVSDDVREQASQTFRTIEGILSAAGTGKQRIVRCGVYLRHIERDFGPFNAAYAQ